MKEKRSSHKAEFGLPAAFTDMVEAIYSTRTFRVRENGNLSSERPQSTGIAQGCPLSPYLFIIVLTVIFDRVDRINGNHPENVLTDSRAGVLDITYADDTLLVSSSTQRVQLQLDTLVATAKSFGLEPNWGKTLHLQVGQAGDLYTPIGTSVKNVSQAVYLGAVLTGTGGCCAALGRRIGEARGAFDKLCAVWKHANINKYEKIKIFEACISSKLLYSLECECLLAADRKRLDGFHCRCLRKVQGFLHPMISHISNAEVLASASAQPISITLRDRQLSLFGKIAALPDTSLVRRVLFVPGSVVPAQLVGKRARGRPKLTWSNTVYALALEACGHDAQVLHNMFCSS